MPTNTISTNVAHGVTLGSGYSSPLTITSTGTVYDHTSGSGIAVDASSYASIISNSGTIESYEGLGVSMATGSNLTNAGYINGYTRGVYIKGGSINNTGTIKSGSYGIKSASGPTTIVNSGLIEEGSPSFSTANDVVGIRLGAGGKITNDGTIIGKHGIYLDGGTLVNNAGGLIEGRLGAALAVRLASTVVNNGTIAGGVSLQAANMFTNSSTGLINGQSVAISATAYNQTLANSGTITSAGGKALYLTAGGYVTNYASGLITGLTTGISIRALGSRMIVNAGTIGGGSIGISFEASGTIINSGTISGGATAIAFSGSGNLLVLENGYKLGGAVVGGTSGTNTLELSGSVGNGVTVNYSTLGLSNFQDILFGAGGYETLKIANTGTIPLTISNFSLPSQTIDLTSVGTNGHIDHIDTITNTVTISGSSGSIMLQFDSTDNFALTTHSDGGGGTDLSVACYCRGTQILTPEGEVPVEALAVGDLLVTLSGTSRPIRWIGRRAYDGRFIACNRQILPIRIAAGALADEVPVRDLRVSPEHAVYIDGVLIPARHLVNGATITQVDGTEQVEYFHVELDTHDVIYADGAPSETYVDCDNRLMFSNGSEYVARHPNAAEPTWQFFAPRLEADDPAMVEVRSALLWRAEFLGHDATGDPDLHMIVDGTVVRPYSSEGLVYRFEIPAGAASVEVASRVAVPAEVDAFSSDRRRLGVPVERIRLQGQDLTVDATHAHAGLNVGFHPDEPSHRWTNGLARLPENWFRSFPAGVAVAIHLRASDLCYRGTAISNPLAPAAGTRGASGTGHGRSFGISAALAV